MKSAANSSNGRNEMDNASNKLAEVIWSELNKGEAVTFEVVQGCGNRVAVTMAIIEGGLISIEFDDETIETLNLHVGVTTTEVIDGGGAQFAKLLKQLTTCYLRGDEGVVCKAGKIQTEYNQYDCKYTEDEFHTFQNHSVIVDGVVVLQFCLTSTAYGKAAKFQRVHNSVVGGWDEGNFEREGFLFMDGLVMTTKQMKGDRRNPMSFVSVCA